MAPTVWQRLGAFVGSASNLRDDQLEAFAAAGGRWIVPVLFDDGATAPWNLEHVDELKARAARYGIECGCWANYFGEDPEQWARSVAAIVGRSGLTGPKIIDAEACVQWPGGKPELLPAVTLALRRALPKASIGVSSLGPNPAYIYNGRTLSPARSFYALGMRFLPQWYDRYIRKDANAWPEERMAWLKANGATDGNFSDPTAPGGRGLPQSYVHATVEVSGLEGSSLAWELERIAAAKAASNYSWGISIYLLENTPESDFALLAAQRDKLFR